MRAWFIVVDVAFDPNECTRRFGIEPSSVITKGEIHPKSKFPAPESSWSFATERAGFDSTDKPLQIILSKLWLKRKEIRDFVRKNGLRIMFRLDTTGALGKRNFLTEFSADTIRKLNYFSARLDIDMY